PARRGETSMWGSCLYPYVQGRSGRGSRGHITGPKLQVDGVLLVRAHPSEDRLGDVDLVADRSEQGPGVTRRGLAGCAGDVGRSAAAAPKSAFLVAPEGRGVLAPRAG